MDKVFHSFIIIIIIVRFLFRRNIYIYIDSSPLSSSTFSTNDVERRLSRSPSPRPPPSGISLVETGFIPVYRSSSSSPVSQRFGENSARNGRAATRLSSTKLIHQHHHRHHHCSFTTRYTSPPHDISPRVIKRPGKVRGGEDGGGGLQPRLIKFWTRIAALRPNFEKRHGVNWKLVSLPIHGGVPWYRKKLPSTLLLPPLFFSHLEREDRLERNQSRYTFWFVWSSIARSTRLKIESRIISRSILVVRIVDPSKERINFVLSRID